MVETFDWLSGWSCRVVLADAPKKVTKKKVVKKIVKKKKESVSEEPRKLKNVKQDASADPKLEEKEKEVAKENPKLAGKLYSFSCIFGNLFFVLVYAESWWWF